MMIRGCAVDSGTLTTDTEIIRMSHCGAFYFNGRYNRRMTWPLLSILLPDMSEVVFRAAQMWTDVTVVTSLAGLSSWLLDWQSLWHCNKMNRQISCKGTKFQMRRMWGRKYIIYSTHIHRYSISLHVVSPGWCGPLCTGDNCQLHVSTYLGGQLSGRI